LTTVLILTSGRPTNKAWDKTPPLKIELETNKSLIKVAGTTILGLQMELLLRNKLYNVYVSLGYRANEIREYCNKQGYHVIFINDEHWEHGAYSSARTLWEIQTLLLQLPTPLITLYNDVIFDQTTLTNLLKCNADVCCMYNSQNIIKWSKKGLEELINILNEDEQYRFNWDGLSYPVWGRLRWNDDISFSNIQDGLMLNITNDNMYRRLKEMSLDWVKNVNIVSE